MYEYYIAHHYHVQESLGYDIGDQARHTFLGGDIIGNTWKWIWDRDKYTEENMIDPFLYTIIGNMPELSEDQQALQNMKFPEQTSAAWEDVSSFADFMSEFSEIIKGVGEAVENADPLIEISEQLDVDDDFVKVIGIVEDYLRYYKFESAAQNEHIRSASMGNWSFNPYNGIVSEPVVGSWPNYYEQICLYGDKWVVESDDGVMENWSSYSTYDKVLVSAMLENFKAFASSPVDSIYILGGTRYDTDITMIDAICHSLNGAPHISLVNVLINILDIDLDRGDAYTSILLVNETGEGLVLYRGCDKDIVKQSMYAPLTKSQTRSMLAGGYSPENWFKLDNNGEHSIASKPDGYIFVTEEYIRFDVDYDQYTRVMNRLTSSTACGILVDEFEVHRLVDEDIYPDLWVWSSDLSSLATEIQKDGEMAYYWDNDNGIDPNLP